MNSYDFLTVLSNCFVVVSSTNALPLTLFIAGFVGGFTHCVPMCGCFLFSQTGEFKKVSQGLLLPYHLGRITTYVLIGLLFASVLNIAYLFMPIRNAIIAPLLFVAGVFFMVNVFTKLKRVFPWADGLRIKPIEKIVSRHIGQLSRDATPLKRYFLGLILGLIPCGLTLAAYLAAASAPNLYMTFLSMLAFGFGTMFALVMSTVTYASFSRKYPEKMHKITNFITVLSGLWLFAMAGFLLF